MFLKQLNPEMAPVRKKDAHEPENGAVFMCV